MATSQHCSMCPYFTLSAHNILQHIVRRHRNAPTFIAHCGAKGCGASFRKYNTFKIHIKRHHNNYEREAVFVEEDNNIEDNFSGDSDMNDEYGELDTTKSEAAFLLKLKAAHGMSDSAIDEVILSVRELYQNRFKAVKETLEPEALQDVNHLLDADEAFEELDSHYKREKYMKQHFGAVMPEAVVMGDHLARKKHQGSYKLSKKTDYGHFVPFLKNLKSLLSMPEVQACLKESRFVSERLMTDVKDGVFLRNSKFLKDHPGALQFAAYTDEFELVNPIGSHTRRHKLCVFYYVLLNIPPEFRSKLSVIQLIAVAKSTDIKRYGSEILLQDFRNALQSLHYGVQLSINDRDVLHYGFLVVFLGDTPAAQSVGGFKEGVGAARKPCRTCDIDGNALNTCFYDKDCDERDEDEHRDRCNELEGLSKEAKLYWSKQYGINGKGLLFSVPEFQLTKCILHDPMHVLLEGIARKQLKLLFVYLIQERYFSIADLGRIIENFNYSTSEVNDKPQRIEAKDLQHSSTLRQTAASMKNLILLLPFMVGHMVPEEDPHWVNFIRFQQIIVLCLSTVASERTYNSLTELIATYLRYFIELYPDSSFTPKMHYLLHFPKQLLQFGPLRHHWCMRMEGKHGLFKRHKWRNFKAIAKSVSEYHQRWMCLQQLQASGKRSETYLYVGDEVNKGSTVSIDNYEYIEVLTTRCTELQNNDVHELLLTPRVQIKGLVYEVGTVLMTSWDDGCLPTLVRVKSIAVVEHVKYLVCADLEIEHFACHFNSFVVKETGHLHAFNAAKDLPYRWPQISHETLEVKYVMLQNVDEVWFI